MKKPAATATSDDYRESLRDTRRQIDASALQSLCDQLASTVSCLETAADVLTDVRPDLADRAA